jgi:hypothetical protein
MTGMEILLVFLAIGVVVVSLCAIPHYFQQRQLNRTIAELANSACPFCGDILGIEAAGKAKAVTYWWTPAPGHSVRDLDLPGQTLSIVCSHCHAELNYRFDGRFFEGPFEKRERTTGPVGTEDGG